MTGNPEITRNDLSALKIIKKIVDRLDADRAAYEDRMNAAQLSLTQMNHMMNILQVQQNAPRGSSQGQYAQTLSLQASGVGAHSHGQNILYTIPPWEPYLTEAEYKVLRAWANGDDILIHLLTEER